MHAASKELLPCVEILEQTPIIIEKLLMVASPADLHWKPAPERWSISEILAHLVDTDALYMTRARRMVEENDPFLESYDQNKAYAEGTYSRGTAQENLRVFCHDRDRSVTWLRYLPASAGGRTARHAELGGISLSQMLHTWACHDFGHIRQISEVYRTAAFFPKMGPFQRYYSLKP